MLARVFGGRGAAQPIQYETARDLAQDPDPKIRADLASRTDTQPEVLYFLAGDTQPEVRQAVAANPAAPGHADVLLAGDDNEEVRGELARKIGRLLPNLAPDKTARLRDMTLSTLHSLTQDQVPRVRAILAEELKSRADAPRDVVLRLAHDLAAIVAAPILEYSPLLSDADLLEIIAKGQLQERLSAIARRQNVSEAVSDAIVATLDVPAVASLLTNPSAQIREETLDAIIDNAAGIETWHKPLVFRNELSLRAIRRIAGFVAASLIDQLAGRHDLPDDLRIELRKAVTKRLEAPEPADDDPEARAKRLVAAGALTEDLLVEANQRGEKDFALHAVALLSGIDFDLTRRAFLARTAKSIVALAWKAGLSARTAVRLQNKIANIPPAAALNARNGFDWPLSEADMETQLTVLAGG
jgi:uncharacterized protein (DUF2336 family)